MMATLILNKIKLNFKTEALRFGFFMFLCFLVFNCEQKTAARLIVEQSVEVHGGIAQWKMIKSLSFDKTTILYLKDGTIESRTIQQQSFIMQPKLKGQIEYLNGGITGLYYDGELFTKRTNDSTYTITDSKALQSATNNFYAQHFVVCQPFKLLDEGAIMKYLGEDVLNGRQVDKIAVSYTNDTEISDQWTYYFDAVTHKLVANKVKHRDNVSLIENLTFDDASGLVFNAHRKSFTLKENSEIEFLRAEYFYGNFKVTY